MNRLSFDATKLPLFVTCPKGLEYLLAEEMESLGLRVEKTSPAGVVGVGNEAVLYRALLESRLANRVLLTLNDTSQADKDGFYAMAAAVEWSDFLRPGQAYWIAAFGTSGDIRHSRFGGQVVKDAISDYFRERNLPAPEINKDAAEQIIHLQIARTSVLAIDAGGRSLHRRGYRLEGEKAPLKENLAAAILLRSGWDRADSHAQLIDPMCGSATLLVEAALMALDIAPGLISSDFLFRHAPWHNEDSWLAVLAAAQERAVLGKRRWQGVIRGGDINPKALQAAKRNIARAGLDRWVQVTKTDALAQLPPETAETESSSLRLLICNPPYGERLGQEIALRSFYQRFGRHLKAAFGGWRAGIFTSNESLAKELGVRANKQYKMFNGKIPTKLYLFDLYEHRQGELQPRESEERTFSHQAQMFANRLQKNLKRLGKWARKEGVEAYRLYDADLPEYAVAVDMYKDAVSVQEYAAPKSVDAEKARQRLLDVLEVVPEICGVPAQQVFLKQRKQQKGLEQYEREAQKKFEFVVNEGGCQLWVNLSDYLDTGLFLDHRPMRQYIQQEAKGKRFLNLFCYTAAATVHAAKGGALATTSVDMSATYLKWGERNLAANGLLKSQHQMVRANVMEWLEQDRGEYDLIFLDPPTFSNSKRMDETFDIQRDHIDLIKKVMRRLHPTGLLIFSNNFRRFRLDDSIAELFVVEDMTKESIPQDFARNEKIHRCYFICHQ